VDSTTSLVDSASPLVDSTSPLVDSGERHECQTFVFAYAQLIEKPESRGGAECAEKVMPRLLRVLRVSAREPAPAFLLDSAVLISSPTASERPALLRAVLHVRRTWPKRLPIPSTCLPG